MHQYPTFPVFTAELELDARRLAATDSSQPPGTYTYIARTGDEDRNHQRTDPAGWRLDTYRANPVVLENHRWENLPIGSATRVWIEQDKLMATIVFADTPRAREVRDLTDQGHMRALSAAWLPLDYELVRDDDGWTIGIHSRTQELVDLSAVTIPAQPQALRVASLAQADGYNVELEVLTALRQLTRILQEAP